jgi:acetylornithine deacetylase/succinyl-diaminopimelate desuccinylase-like protein
MNIQQSLSFAQQNSDRFLEELISFIAIESVSSDPERSQDVRKAAIWLSDKLKSLGLDHVTIFDTPLHPVVYAEKVFDQAAPTILVYGHYDVQPESPIELWNTPPFDATVVGSRLVARGATDMKGQIIAGLAAVEALLFGNEPLPFNLNFIYEGEEEIGSPSIREFLKEHKELLAADVVLNLDAGMLNADTPSITYALRGLAYFELLVKGPAQDLHSGIFGGVVDNPAIVLSQLIAGMKDDQHRITLPGFYDDVRSLSDNEREELTRIPQTTDTYLTQTGVPQLAGEQGYSCIEQNTARPTLDIHGLLSGFTGEGAKTVIPAWAKAKISMRLVPDQDPAKVADQLKQYLSENAPPTVVWDLKTFTGGYPAFCDPDQPASKALQNAFELMWGKRPVLKREGASIPIVTEMKEILGVDSVLSGFALPEDNMHAPNETLNLEVWRKGILTIIHFFDQYSKQMADE